MGSERLSWSPAWSSSYKSIARSQNKGLMHARMHMYKQAQTHACLQQQGTSTFDPW